MIANTTLKSVPKITKQSYKDFELSSGQVEGLIKGWNPTGFDNITCAGQDLVI